MADKKCEDIKEKGKKAQKRPKTKEKEAEIQNVYVGQQMGE